VLLNLANYSGLRDASELYLNEIADFLFEIKDQYPKWNKHSPNRYAFQSLLRNAGVAVDQFWISL